MNRRRSRLITACFAVLLATGLVFTLIGIILIPMLPTLMLDVVIDSKEMADGPKREEVLSILKKAWGNTAALWSIAGLLIVAVSGLGLWASCTPDPSSVNA